MIIKNLLMALAITTAIISSAFAKQVTHYDWIVKGQKTGFQTVTQINEYQYSSNYEFTDRGRGPKVTETITLNENGLIIDQKISGNSYYGAKIDESYQYKQGEAKWRTTYENESRKLDKNYFYYSADGTYLNLELLVQAIDKQKNKSLTLLPSGTASIQKLMNTRVTKGEESREVTLIAINGLDLTPIFAWFDQDLNFFAYGSSWGGLVLRGWGDNLTRLLEFENETTIQYYQKLAERHTKELTGITLFTNINVFNAVDDELIGNTQVAIKNGKIIAIGEGASELKQAKTIDGQGLTMMPGLWDMHSHMSLISGLLNVANGVTSVRDLGNDHDQLMKLIKAFDSAEAIGPSIYRGGMLDKKSAYSIPVGKIATTLDEALEYVDWYSERGYQQIKIYSSIEPEWVESIVEHAHTRNMRVGGHIPSFMSAEQAVMDGYNEIQHINMVFLNFLASDKDDTRTPLRFMLVAEKAGDLNLNSKQVEDFIALLNEKNVVIDPTVTIFQSMFLNKAGEIDPSYEAVADILPASYQRYLLGQQLDITKENEKQYERSAQALLDMVHKLYLGGVRLVAGTDGLAGFTLHRELELYVKAGIPNREVLKIATVNAARIAGRDDVGTIEEGKVADLILIDGNPLENISEIRKVALVVKDGRMFKPHEMFKSIGVKPFTTAYSF
ncbi:amidohydrolase family protein [Thalassotalea sp. PS06]|uniref:amidohydrolase family protein n=1 Tax=Thalassotalea sp. PS06 TaxID=2594005 RepID=UPI00116280CB|nr:amidohydrolase family protein [Thalassotalea sp. PS06]QDP00966.1 amidohydrolase family protein [Thalassotalea sp. PS06]